MLILFSQYSIEGIFWFVCTSFYIFFFTNLVLTNQHIPSNKQWPKINERRILDVSKNVFSGNDWGYRYTKWEEHWTIVDAAGDIRAMRRRKQLSMMWVLPFSGSSWHKGAAWQEGICSGDERTCHLEVDTASWRSALGCCLWSLRIGDTVITITLNDQ